MAFEVPDNHSSNKNDASNSGTRGMKRTKTREITLTIPRWFYCYIPVLSVLVAIVASLAISYRRLNFITEKSHTLGFEALDIFANFDKDGDLYLSLEEAQPLLLQFISQSKDKNSTLNLDVKAGEDSVEVYASFIPLNISTMTKDFEHDPTGNQSFSGLFEWTSATIPSKEFAVSSFYSFLPDLNRPPIPGTVYDIVESPKGMFGYSNLPSTRFYPPRAMGTEFFIYRLLSMFHPRPFVLMRFPPQGVKGCVRAVNEEFIEVVIRMHVEFQLNEPPTLPFWFTPAQLTGSLVMAKNGTSLKHFHLYVPNERRLNVDMEWLTDEKVPESMEVDIGYMPLMDLSIQDSLQERETTGTSSFEWDQEISKDEANQLIEESFFPFKIIKYHNLTDAFHIAKEESKLVHSIMLWGALDDQSC